MLRFDLKLHRFDPALKLPCTLEVKKTSMFFRMYASDFFPTSNMTDETLLKYTAEMKSDIW